VKRKTRYLGDTAPPQNAQLRKGDSSDGPFRYPTNAGKRGPLALLDATGVNKGAMLCADKGHDTCGFLGALTRLGIEAQLARNTRGRCGADPSLFERHID